MISTNRKRIALAVLCLTLVSLVSCASGPKFKELNPGIAPDNPEMGRIFFYRTTVLGAAVQPEVLLNGKPVGSAVPGGFFYVDSPPGDYQVTTKTEVERKLSFMLEKGQTRFVKLLISIGFFVGHVYGELVEEETALKELPDCKSTMK